MPILVELRAYTTHVLRPPPYYGNYEQVMEMLRERAQRKEMEYDDYIAWFAANEAALRRQAAATTTRAG